MFSLLQPDYLQLTPIGTFPHARGYQYVDAAALDALVKHFNSFLARLGRRFAGVPFYIGHPDVPGYQNIYTDRKAYGWIMDLEIRDDGLYGKPKWSAAGQDLISNGHFKFLSPYWEAAKIGMKDGKPLFRPTVLISVGLTNEPNLPVLPLANNTDTAEPTPLLGSPLPILDCDGSTPLSDAQPDTQPPESNNPTLNLNPAPTAENTSDLSGSAPSVSSALNNLASLESRLASCREQFAALHQRLVTTVLDNAIAGARILPAEYNYWRAQLQSDFDATSAHLANLAPKLNLHSRTENLHRIVSSGPARQKQILALVNERIRTSGLSFNAAWRQTKQDHPTLFS